MPKKTKKEGKILNSPKESPIDVTGIGYEGQEKWEAKTLAAESETKLEADKGEGREIKLFFFDYTANPLAFKDRQPTAQELFNNHFKQVEITMWAQGFSVYADVPPRLMFAKDKSHYRFVVAGVPSKGRILREESKTLTEIASGR